MIPNTAHFVWFGKHLPWAHGLAVLSAARRGGFERVFLHHEEELANDDVVAALTAAPAVELRRLAPETLLGGINAFGRRLVAVYQRLSTPAARANMVRAAILAKEGGVYLDTDTITLREFTPLLDCGIFCGTEHIVLPGSLYRRRHPLPWIRAGLKLAARDLCRRLPNGWRTFRYIEKFYEQAVNNAVLGAEKGHPFCSTLLERMIEMDPRRQLVRYSLGTHLLQELVAEYRDPDLIVHPPPVFYPLGPEISQHWFRHHPEPPPAEVFTPETICAHWYGSVRTVRLIPRIDPAYIRSRAETQWFSALTAPLLP